jgi:S-adenosylmethionine:tRNA ribosyltransferase-isomerase
MPSFPIDYDLPADLIAQEPAEPRDHSRVLVVRRDAGTLAHHRFHELPDLLAPHDLLILNDTRVLPARLLGKRIATGGKWEGLFLRGLTDGTWEMVCQTRGRLQPGDRIAIDPGPLEIELLARLPEGRWHACPHMDGSPLDLLGRFGHMPLPPYIRKGVATDADRTRYQTVYSRQPGAVAAPTAGLHFTPAVFDRLRERGIARSFVTLHVGFGTFRPIEVDDYTRHPMHHEWGELPDDTVGAIDRCRQRGGRVVAVGTTAVRVLETAAQCGALTRWSGETDLFIYPPYQFHVVDALVTNFHLPRTTLLLLVAAFAGVELAGAAYRTAVAEGYRFYSYGDAMLVLP